MKRVLRKLLSTLLALVMVLSLMPMSALADEVPDTSQNTSGMEFTKSVTSNNDGTYTVTMEAYATGTASSVTSAKTLDVVLVLDVSGSMDEAFSPSESSYTPVYNISATESYYVNGWQGYKKEVSFCTTCNAWTDGCRNAMGGKHRPGTAYTPMESESDTANDHVQFYSYQYTPATSKLTAMKMAVNSFITSVGTKSPKSQIAIVKYAGDEKGSTGNDMSSGENYTQVVVDLTAASNVENLTAAVNALQAGGATAADYGLKKAQGILNSSTSENDKVVILFTDGEPNHGSGFDFEVATDTVNLAKEMKQGGTTIYTVGVFQSASDDVKTYMNSVSSKYPQAVAETQTSTEYFFSIPVTYVSGWSVTQGTASTGNYYINATDETTLINAFQSIADAVAPANAALNAFTVVEDTLSPYLIFNDTVTPANSVKVYTANLNGQNKTEAPNSVTAGISGKTVSVIGYDFAAHHQGGASAQKLIIEITAKPSGTGYSSSAIPTNADSGTDHAAKVTLNNQTVTSAQSPTVDGYSVTYNANGGSWTAPDILYYLPGTNVAVTDSVPTKAGFAFAGWTVTTDNTQVTTPTISDENKTFTMPAANVTLTAQWTAEVTGVTKALVMDDPGLSGVTFASYANSKIVNNKLTADKGDTVTLLYKITVSGGAGATFTVTEDSADTELVSGTDVTQNGTAYTGTVGTNGSTEFYVAKTFTITGTANEKLGNEVTVTGITPMNPGKVDVETQKYNVTYQYTTTPVGAPAVPVVTQHQAGDTVTIADDPTLAGYTFSGWTTSDATIVDGKFTMPAKPVTLTGTWTASTVEVDLTGLELVNKSYTSTYGVSDTDTFYFVARIVPAASAASLTDNADNTAGYTVNGSVNLSAGETKLVNFNTITLPVNVYNVTVTETAGTRTNVTYDASSYSFQLYVRGVDDVQAEKADNDDAESANNGTFTNKFNGIRYIPYIPASDPTVKVRGLDTVNHVAYIVGRNNGLVDPNGVITRAEVATIYFRLMTEEFRNQYWSDHCSYTDVADTAWYNVAIATLEKAGIIKDSVTGGTFRPNEPITRAELAVMAAQFCTVSGSIPKTSFTDISRAYWAADEIALVEYAGWIEGYNGKFRPDDNLTRAECVTIVNRMLNRGAEHENMLAGMVTFPDNPATNKQWYYEAIQEAANSHHYTRTGKRLTGEHFNGEKWTELLPAPRWAAMEQAWANANRK